MKKAIFIALFFVLNLTIVKAQFEFKYRKLTTEDGLPSNTIYSICEDKKGNIVLGTDNGIAIFNGNQFNNLNFNNGLSRPYVVASTADKNGTVWAVSYFGQLQKLVNSKIINTNISTSYYNEILTTGNEILLFNRFNRLPNNMGYQYLLLTTSGKQKPVKQSDNFRTKMVLPFYVQNNEKIEIVNNNIVYKAYRIPLPNQISLLHKIIFRKNDVCLLDDNFLSKNRIVDEPVSLFFLVDILYSFIVLLTSVSTAGVGMKRLGSPAICSLMSFFLLRRYSLASSSLTL
jgi:hypothetical protein